MAGASCWAKPSPRPICASFVTLVRFDPAYHGLFKCNIRRLADYPRLSAYLARVSLPAGRRGHGQHRPHQGGLLLHQGAQPLRHRAGRAGRGMDGARRTGRLTSCAGRPGAVVPIPAMTPMRSLVFAKPAEVAVAKDCRTPDRLAGSSRRPTLGRHSVTGATDHGDQCRFHPPRRRSLRDAALGALADAGRGAPHARPCRRRGRPRNVDCALCAREPFLRPYP